ncbi:hypothetical protein ALMA_0811 [Alloscardovia macacae]|uniref:DUF3071 domain-containing protein n=2 Tax=Alloscardovia macacae TaxID=1160091 RepID=A0A261F5F8_9BIFI|nr:hypothetical protein ALMA_0811 [Alloscardovia macacae]
MISSLFSWRESGREGHKMAGNANTANIMVTFMRVDDRGNLILRDPLTRDTFILEVTDELEQGILAAKQTRRDHQGSPKPQTEKALPLSAIQTLIRSGHSYDDIARDYAVAPALVRRFAAPVEKEKQFIVGKFLDTVLTDRATSSRVRDVIISTVASLGSDFSEISWTATREGHSPWRVKATYTSGYSSQSTSETAEWMYNPRDRSVVCVNMPAKRLLGEVSSAASPVDKELFSTDAVPIITADPTGASGARTASSGAVSMRTGSFESVSMKSMREDTHMSTGAFRKIVSAPVKTPVKTDGKKSTDAQKAPRDSQKTQGTADAPAFTPEAGSSAGSASAHASAAGMSETDTSSTSTASTSSAPSTPSTPRKRSAIPAWDDILFGPKGQE